MSTGAENGQSADISIYNSLGELIIFDEDAPVKNAYDLREYGKGTYNVKVTIDNEVLTKELIIFKPVDNPEYKKRTIEKWFFFCLIYFYSINLSKFGTELIIV